LVFPPPRGFLIAAIGIVLVISGAGLFDNSYQAVEPIMKTKHNIIEDQTILPHQSLNSTIPSELLVDHNVILVHVKPTSDSIKFLAVDPTGDIFTKESKNGFVYHILTKQQQAGNYSIAIYSQSNAPINVNAIVGEDPYLSSNCDSSYGLQCDTIQVYIGFVIIGVIAFIVGALLAITDLRRKRKVSK
jgi:hypothetical protein